MFTHETDSTVNDSSQSYASLAYETCVGYLEESNVTYVLPESCDKLGGIGYVVHYNYTGIHSALLFQNLADEALVSEAIGDDSFQIKLTVHPLPSTKEEKYYEESDKTSVMWFLMCLSFPFITGTFGAFVVSERETKAKHLQTVAGVKPRAYWLSTWLFDILNYQIPCWFTIAMMYIFDNEIMVTRERGVVGGILAIIILFGQAGASFTYCISFLFTSPAVCNTIVIVSGFLVGFGGSMAVVIMKILGGADPGHPNQLLLDIATALTWILRFHPCFCLAHGLNMIGKLF
jgi:ATP-binding cassette, subfamily A (ABC1), member 3